VREEDQEEEEEEKEEDKEEGREKMETEEREDGVNSEKEKTVRVMCATLNNEDTK
jgi:hypothetical protein